LPATSLIRRKALSEPSSHNQQVADRQSTLFCAARGRSFGCSRAQKEWVSACDMLCGGALPLGAVHAALACKVPELTPVSKTISNEHYAIVASSGPASAPSRNSCRKFVCTEASIAESRPPFLPGLGGRALMTERNAFAADETSTPRRSQSAQQGPAVKVLQLVAQHKFDTTASYRHHYEICSLPRFPGFRRLLSRPPRPEGVGYAP
jgi:hypothetical protein